MKCVIAALADSTGGTPLALTNFLGSSLLERALANCRQLGLTSIILLTNDNDSSTRRVADNLAKNHGLELDHATKAPAASIGEAVIEAEHVLKDQPWLLLDIGYQITPELLGYVQDKAADANQILVASSPIDVDASFDQMPILRLHSDSGQVNTIGYELTEYNAYAAGVIGCTAQMLTIFKDLIAEGKAATLEMACQRLARDGQVQSLDVTGYCWSFADCYQSLQTAEDVWLDHTACQVQPSFLKKHLLRPLTFRLSSAMVAAPLSVNGLAIVTTIIACLAALLFSFASYSGLLLGGVLAGLVMISQISLHEVASLRATPGQFDSWLGHVLATYNEAVLLAGLTAHLLPHGARDLILLGALAVIGSVMYGYSHASYYLLHRSAPISEDSFNISGDLRMLVIVLAAILNQPVIGLMLAAVVLNSAVIRRMVIWHQQEAS